MSGSMINILDSEDQGFDALLTALLNRNEGEDAEVEQTVKEILHRVRLQGDAAILGYTKTFDRISLTTVEQLELPPERLQRAVDDISPEQRQALETAANRIRQYHERQLDTSWSYQEANGTRLGQRITPLDRVGLYVPGGKAAYPSSVLMNAIPAKVAGVSELLVTVPTPKDEVNEMVLAAAHIAGVDRVFRVGGAQAIAALAYGTELIPKVDKIVGPGNVYVATAKRLVFGQVGIDMIAGPSEVVIVGDGSVDPDWVAMDLFAQAEHDELAQSIFIGCDNEYLSAVEESITRLLPTLERERIVKKSLKDHGALIKVGDFDEAARVVNHIAPEHLELLLEEADVFMEKIRHAGAIFVGPYSAEVLGDYCAGPNHVLPTSGTARFSSPLGVYDFQKRTSIIACSAKGADELGKTASVLAHSESLTAHARSAEYRLRR